VCEGKPSAHHICVESSTRGMRSTGSTAETTREDVRRKEKENFSIPGN
jgi:hypothetical protein